MVSEFDRSILTRLAGVADSDPATEQAGCEYKARALFKAAEEAVRFAERAKLGNR